MTFRAYTLYQMVTASFRINDKLETLCCTASCLVAMDAILSIRSCEVDEHEVDANYNIPVCKMDFRDYIAAHEDSTGTKVDLKRASRFVTDKSLPMLFQSPNMVDLNPFYGGQVVASRMTEVRKSIDYIRDNWEDRAEFAKTLAEFLRGKTDGNDDKEFAKLVDNVKNRERNWGDIDKQQLVDGDFEVIRLFTSDLGYVRIFSFLNSLFRDDETTKDPRTIQTIVFLIELINIDLYNYCLKFPQYDNFTGVVYRGVGLSESDFDAFSDLIKQEIPKRYIAIPLALLSSSTDIEEAKKFIKQTHEAVLFKIHILELKPAFLKYYKERNPIGVVSTICAVDVQNLSHFPTEKEILLRGPFFQVLDFFKDDKEKLHVLEVCMLNSNRDHLSSKDLKEPDVRKMFGLMIAVSRNEFAVEFCKNRGKMVDAAGYQTLLDKAKQDLALLIPNDLVYGDAE